MVQGVSRGKLLVGTSATRRQWRPPGEAAVSATCCPDNCGLRFERTEQVSVGRESDNKPGTPFI